MKTRFLPVALATVVLTLSACGGSGAPSQPKGPISEDRTAAFKSMMPEFTRMGKMVKDEEPYDVEKFKQAAATFAENSKNRSPCLNPTLKATAAPCLPSGQTQQHSKPKKKNLPLRLKNSTPPHKPANWKKSKPLTAKPVQPANPATTHSAVRNKA